MDLFQRLVAILIGGWRRLLRIGAGSKRLSEPEDEHARLLITARDEPTPELQLEFVGGCRDGETLSSPLANVFYWQADHGRVGARFEVLSDAGVDAILAGEAEAARPRHTYEIVSSEDRDGVRYLRAKAR